MNIPSRAPSNCSYCIFVHSLYVLSFPGLNSPPWASECLTPCCGPRATPLNSKTWATRGEKVTNFRMVQISMAIKLWLNPKSRQFWAKIWLH